MKHLGVKAAAAILSAVLILPTTTGAMNYLSPFRGYFEKIEQNRAKSQTIETEVVIEAKYDEVSQFSEGLAAVRVGDKWGYIDDTGKEFLAPSLAWAGDFKDGVAYVLEYANMKTADDKKPVAYVTKESIQNFTSGKTRFPTLGLGGGMMSNIVWYIDKDGRGAVDGFNTLWATQSDILSGTGDDGVIILNGNPYSQKKQEVTQKYMIAVETYENKLSLGMVLIKDATVLRTYEGKFVGGYENAAAVDKAVNGVIPMYAYSGITTSDVTYAKENIPDAIPEESRVFKAFYMDLDGNITKVFPYNPKAYYLADEDGNIEDTGERAILFVSAPEEGLTYAEIGYIYYTPDGNIYWRVTGSGLLNVKNEWVIAPEAGYRIASFKNDYVFDGAVVVVDLESKLMGLYDINGKEILPAKFTKITNFVNGFAYAEKDGKMFLIDTAGKEYYLPGLDGKKTTDPEALGVSLFSDSGTALVTDGATGNTYLISNQVDKDNVFTIIPGTVGIGISSPVYGDTVSYKVGDKYGFMKINLGN